jgi:hypothetical protein
VLAILVGLYFLLPMKIMVPVEWWAVHVRMIAPGYLVGVASVRRARRGLPPVLLAPALGLAIAWSIWLAVDLRRHYNGVEMAGFDQAMAAIPPGQHVQLLLPEFSTETHYEHFPYAYVLGYYVAEKGGLGLPMMMGHPRDLWAVAWKPPPAANWGRASLFRWALHARGWGYFVVKDPPGAWRLAVFHDAPSGRVELVGQYGLWRVYRQIEPPPTGEQVHGGSAIILR